MELPSDFTAMMRRQYGDTLAERLFEGLAQPPVVSVRLNPAKLSADDEKRIAQGIPTDGSPSDGCTTQALRPVPWCPHAYYLDERPAFTFDPLFHAGAYYVQEAASMFVAEVLRQHAHLPAAAATRLSTTAADSQSTPAANATSPATNATSPATNATSPATNATSPATGAPALRAALDLCAAPGGKSTLLRSLLPDDCLLVSNEPIAKRTYILAENMAKWGHPLSLVTQNFPADFRPLTHTFDIILCDVPCSGEGMFRKDDGAIRDWSPENVDTCWQRQRDIVEAIWPTLRPGGLLVYSTCTFNSLEDEDNVQWIAAHLGADILPIAHDPAWGIVETVPGCLHFLPGISQGEGFFVAALRKHGTADTDPSTTDNAKAATDNAKAATDIAALSKRLSRALRTAAVPPEQQVMRQDYGNNELPAYDLSYSDALSYLRREGLRLPTTYPDGTPVPRGQMVVTYHGLPLGLIKNIGTRANNLYPQEWRIRTTYTTPFSLLPKS